MNKIRKSYLELHVAVFLFGFTAILGDLISLTATNLVWWRVLITSLSFFFLTPIIANLKQIPRQLIWTYAGIGILVAVHWITFFASIKYSNASICLVCMATSSFFTAVVEPLITKEKWKKLQIGLGLLIVPGMILIVKNLEGGMMLGVGLGLISAFLAATFSSLNKKYIQEADPYDITFIELTTAWLFISFLLPFIYNSNEPFLPQGMDWVYLLILALLCTTLAYVLSLRALQHISAFASNLVVNLEPIYGILFAIFILGDHKELNGNFYIGCGIILLAVFGYPLLRKRIE